MVNCECFASFKSHSLWLSGRNHNSFDPHIQVRFDWEGSFIPDQTTDLMIRFTLPLLFLPIFRSARSLYMHYLFDDDDQRNSEYTSTKIFAVRFLGFFHNLVTLRLVGNVHLTLFPLLEQHFHVSSTREVQDFILPSLQALEFNAYDSQTDDGRGLKVLWAFLELRARAGIPIKTILFKVCNIGQEYQSIGEEFGVDISSVDHF